MAIVGPTAVGKSDLALRLAPELDGEIVNADAMQLYAGMDVATAKPTAAQRAAVPHHMLDTWPLSTTASVLEYRDAARDVARALWNRGQVPILVGGSPLYLKAVCDELDIPPTDPDVRRKYSDRLEVIGSAALHAELSVADPRAAAAIDVGNGRRIVRALEVVELQGYFRASLPEPTSWADTVWLGLIRSREALDERIAVRTRAWFSPGLLEEVTLLLDEGLAESVTARKAAGYEQAMAVIEGRLSIDEAVEETINLTRKLARRQERTLKQDDRVNWLAADSPDLPDQALSIFGTHVASD